MHLRQASIHGPPTTSTELKGNAPMLGHSELGPRKTRNTEKKMSKVSFLKTRYYTFLNERKFLFVKA